MYSEKEKTCCFTGHRDIPKNQIQNISESLEKEIEKLIEKGYTRFAAGGAYGFDSIAEQTIIKLKKKYPKIRLILVLPYHKQTPFSAFADEIFYAAIQYFSGCMHKRNRMLVDMSSICICYLTRDTGGTAYTVKYAEKQKLQILYTNNS